MTTIGLYDIGTSTTLESNKSHDRYLRHFLLRKSVRLTAVIRSNRIFQFISLVERYTAGFSPARIPYPNMLWTSAH